MEWLEKNRKLLFVVLFLWLGSFFLYHLTGPDVEKLGERAQKIIQYAKDIATDKSNETQNLANLMAELERSASDEFWMGVLRNISLGFFVAGVLMLGVEIHTHGQIQKDFETYRKDVESDRKLISTDVWKYIAERLTCPEISQEVENILKSDVLRVDCSYIITLEKPYAGMPHDFIVVKREIEYDAINLTNIDGHPYEISSVIQTPHSDITTTDGTKLPRHISCKIDGEKVPMKDCIDKKNPLRFKHEINLPKSNGKGVHVYLECEEPCRRSDQNVYTFARCTKNLTIIVNNNIKSEIKLEQVKANHPRLNQMWSPGGDKYILEGGFFPGQGFSVEWGNK